MATPAPQVSGMQDILDLKEINLWSLGWLWISLGIGIFLVICFLLWKWFQHRRLQRPRKKILITPLEEALKNLDSLAERPLSDPSQIRPFFFSLSEIFRHFLERELCIAAEEATLEELKPLLRECPDLTQEEIREAFWMLDLADMAKFARFIPKKEEIVRSVKSCRLLITALARRRAAKTLPEFSARAPDSLTEGRIS